jgi:hypothetical protein
MLMVGIRSPRPIGQGPFKSSHAQSAHQRNIKGGRTQMSTPQRVDAVQAEVLEVMGHAIAQVPQQTS